MTWEVSTPVYEGPFDLLLHLILREQVDLYEVSLSGIVDAYLAELDEEFGPVPENEAAAAKKWADRTFAPVAEPGTPADARPSRSA